MSDTSSFITSNMKNQDPKLDLSLRPKNLSEFFGQEIIKRRLEVVTLAAKQRGEAPGHCLLCGPPGLGKTSLANIIANQIGKGISMTSGPLLDKPADLMGILTSLQDGEVLFIDEIHRMNKSAEEYLYSAMEDFCIDLVIDSGPSARSVRVSLAKFTLVGATTRSGLLSAPLRSRFSFVGKLEYYDIDPLVNILNRASKIIGIEIEEPELQLIAQRSRGTPRIANNLLRWVRDFAQIEFQGEINKHVVEEALHLLAIDKLGLNEIDLKILQTIMEYYGGGPVGLNTIALAIGEEPSTLAEVHEPFLILCGFIKRTARGRVITESAKEHLKMTE